MILNDLPTFGDRLLKSVANKTTEYETNSGHDNILKTKRSLL